MNHFWSTFIATIAVLDEPVLWGYLAGCCVIAVLIAVLFWCLFLILDQVLG